MTSLIQPGDVYTKLMMDSCQSTWQQSVILKYIKQVQLQLKISPLKVFLSTSCLYWVYTFVFTFYVNIKIVEWGCRQYCTDYIPLFLHCSYPQYPDFDYILCQPSLILLTESIYIWCVDTATTLHLIEFSIKTRGL